MSSASIQQRSTAAPNGVLEVAPDVVCLPLSIVNVYFVGPPRAGDRNWVLVDAGLAFSTESIARAAAERFGAGARPAAIVLTHGHFDHVGALPQLAEQWQAPIYAHRLELPYLTGRSSYPPPDPTVGGGMMSFLSRFYPRGPYNFSGHIHPLPADNSVPGLPDWRWVATPGHSPGHVSFFRDGDRTLLVGDAFVTAKQESALGAALKEPHEVRRPPAYFTPDWESARRSVETLAGLRPECAATGHGWPMCGEELRRGLEALLRNWDEVAVPDYGRYVGRPAVAGPEGVESVPPPVPDHQLWAAAGIGLAIAAGTILARRR